jgi:hypothetical protein
MNLTVLAKILFHRLVEFSLCKIEISYIFCVDGKIAKITELVLYCLIFLLNQIIVLFLGEVYGAVIVLYMYSPTVAKRNKNHTCNKIAGKRGQNKISVHCTLYLCSIQVIIGGRLTS